MSQKPIAIIGSVDPNRTDYDPALKNANTASAAARALGKELAHAKHPILVFSSNPSFVEANIVAGYVASGEALSKSIIMLYPRDRDPTVHGDFPEQRTHPALFDPKTDPHPRWEVSYYQSLPDVKGILIMGGGRATLIMGLMALANRIPIVSLACFGGSAEEIWAMATNKPWIDPDDRNEMGRTGWTDNMAEAFVKSFDKQRANLDKLAQDQTAAAERIRKDREQRSQYATGFGISAALLTVLGVFGNQPFRGSYMWLIIYALCFIAVPISAGIAGSMFFTLRQRRNVSTVVHPPSVKETRAHGLWAGLGSAVLFFVSQVTANRDIKSLSQAVIEGVGGLDILLLFSLMIGFVSGLTYEAVFGKWEAVDASRAGMIETGPA
jgi:hypothetical protein